MYLQRRNRILRATPAIRSMVAETILTPNDFIVPLFIDEGDNIQTEIASMPNYYRRTLDLTVKEVKELWGMGIKSVLLFIKCKDELKDNTGKEACFMITDYTGNEVYWNKCAGNFSQETGTVIL